MVWEVKYMSLVNIRKKSYGGFKFKYSHVNRPIDSSLLAGRLLSVSTSINYLALPGCPTTFHGPLAWLTLYRSSATNRYAHQGCKVYPKTLSVYLTDSLPPHSPTDLLHPLGRSVIQPLICPQSHSLYSSQTALAPEFIKAMTITLHK